MPGQHTVTWDNLTPASVSVTCGWCRRDVEANRISAPVEVDRRDQPRGAAIVVVGALHVCPRSACRKPSLVFTEFHTTSGDVLGVPSVAGQLPRGTATEMEGLSEAVESVRAEAWSCHYGGDYRAALVMGRAAVQRAVRTLGGEGRDLYKEIDDLRQKGIVTEELKEWAHEVRLSAREAAHPDELGEVSAEDALESLRFMDDFLQFAIALPEARKARQAARKATS